MAIIASNEDVPIHIWHASIFIDHVVIPCRLLTSCRVQSTLS